MENIKRLDAYLDTRDAYIAYQKRTHKALQTLNQVLRLLETDTGVEDEMAAPDTPGEHVLSSSPIVVDAVVGAGEDQTDL